MINNKSYTPISIKILSQNHQETPQIMFKKTKIMKKNVLKTATIQKIIQLKTIYVTCYPIVIDN